MKLYQGLTVLMCCILAIFAPRSAFADTPAPVVHKTSVYSGFNYLSGSQNETKVDRKSMYAGLGYRPLPFLELTLAMHVGFTDFNYRVEQKSNNLYFDAALRQNAEPWINPGVRVRLLQVNRFKLELFGDLEMPLAQKKPMDIKHVHINSTQLGDIDSTNFFAEHVQTYYTWYSYALGVTAKLRFGNFEPRIDIGARRFNGGVRLKLDGQTQSILHLLGQQNFLKPEYPLDYFSPIASIGIDYNISSHFTATARGMAFPASEGLFLNFGGALKWAW